jgi:hypothetical protein
VLLASRQQIEQHPHRRSVEKDDGRSHGGLGEGDVVEEIRHRHAHNPQQKAAQHVLLSQRQSGAAAQPEHDGSQDQQGEADARLRDDDRIEGPQRVRVREQASRENCTAQAGGATPAKGGGRDGEISTDGMPVECGCSASLAHLSDNSAAICHITPP